jgi:hypothetical protein
MKVFEFVFSFLYVRNWYSGQMELSRPRVILFTGMLLMILLGVLIASLLQAPISYTRPA